MTNKPSQQQPAEGERERHPLQDILDKENETGDWTTTKLIAALIIDRDNLKAELAHINGAPTAISPTEEEIEQAVQYSYDTRPDWLGDDYYLYRHAFNEGQRYTRQGGEK